MDHEIVVRGSAEARVPPDRAEVDVTIEADGSSSEAAYAAAAEPAARVDAVLARHAGEIDRTTTDALTVLPLSRWRKGESVRTGWRASRRTAIELSDLARLGELLAELAAAGGTVVGPRWRVDPANEVFEAVRRAAAADARRRAEAYAAGLGQEIGDVRWLAEPGLRSPADHFGGPPTTMAAMAGGAFAAEDAVIDISPADVLVTATIEASFALA